MGTRGSPAGASCFTNLRNTLEEGVLFLVTWSEQGVLSPITCPRSLKQSPGGLRFEHEVPRPPSSSFLLSCSLSSARFCAGGWGGPFAPQLPTQQKLMPAFLFCSFHGRDPQSLARNNQCPLPQPRREGGQRPQDLSLSEQATPAP